MKLPPTSAKVLALTTLKGSHVLQCYDGATGRFLGYLTAFDPDAFDGRGYVNASANMRRALRFKSFGDAFECWKMQSDAVPLRDDGEPNRPLTAYTVQIARIA